MNQILTPTIELHNPLADLIRQEIEAAGGHISFARFMQLALYTPELGYYSAAQTTIGKTGDFLTASEISPLFAKSIANQCLEIYSNLKKKQFLEIGAGSGVFARDILLEFDKLNSSPENYFIFEVSEELKTKQKKLLQSECPHLLPHIIWLDHLPPHFQGIIFANEVMDAFPVHCFRIDDQILEKRVTWQDNQFFWLPIEAEKNLADKVLELQDIFSLPNNYESEYCMQLPTWIQSLANILAQGVILLFDYGYGAREFYHPDRNRGTLMCYYQQQRHDNPLINIGLQDITAHVDFTLAATAAVAAGLSVVGYTTQASFLMSCGILESSDLSWEDKSAIKKLMLPSQMGEAIKVLGLSKNFDFPLKGFQLFDRRKDL